MYFNKKTVIAALIARKENIEWNRIHLPLADSLRLKYDNDIDLIDSILDEVREMPA